MNKKGQFYLVSTIVIVGLLIGLAVTFNYSSRDNSYQAQEIAKELRIESEKVIDYDTISGQTKFEDDFGKEYSSYIGGDKEIYFIDVEGEEKSAYKYVEGIRTDLSSSISVVGEEIQFILDGNVYKFDLEEGRNIYFLVTQETGGQKYVFSG